MCECVVTSHAGHVFVLLCLALNDDVGEVDVDDVLVAVAVQGGAQVRVAAAHDQETVVDAEVGGQHLLDVVVAGQPLVRRLVLETLVPVGLLGVRAVVTGKSGVGLGGGGGVVLGCGSSSVRGVHWQHCHVLRSTPLWSSGRGSGDGRGGQCAC